MSRTEEHERAMREIGHTENGGRVFGVGVVYAYMYMVLWRLAGGNSLVMIMVMVTAMDNHSRRQDTYLLTHSAGVGRPVCLLFTYSFNTSVECIWDYFPVGRLPQADYFVHFAGGLLSLVIT